MPTAANNYYHGIGMIDNFDLDRLTRDGMLDGENPGGNAYVEELFNDSQRMIDSAAVRRVAELKRNNQLEQEQLAAQARLRDEQIEDQFRAAVNSILTTPRMNLSQISERVNQARQKYLQDKSAAAQQAKAARTMRDLQQKRVEVQEMANAEAAKYDFNLEYQKGQLPFQRAKTEADRIKAAQGTIRKSESAEEGKRKAGAAWKAQERATVEREASGKSEATRQARYMDMLRAPGGVYDDEESDISDRLSQNLIRSSNRGDVFEDNRTTGSRAVDSRLVPRAANLQNSPQSGTAWQKPVPTTDWSKYGVSLINPADGPSVNPAFAEARAKEWAQSQTGKPEPRANMTGWNQEKADFDLATRVMETEARALRDWERQQEANRPAPASRERYDPVTDLYYNREGVPEPAWGGKSQNAVAFLNRTKAERDAKEKEVTDAFYATPEGRQAQRTADAAARTIIGTRGDPNAGFIASPRIDPFEERERIGRDIFERSWANPAVRARTLARQS